MASHPTASVIIIGDEILKGQTKDTNSNFLCQELYQCGIKVQRVSVIPDNIDVIADEVSTHSAKYSYVFTSGGIGPTHDDVTYAGIAKAFSENLVMNKELNDMLKTWCKSFSFDESAVYKMSQLPSSARLHHDPEGKFFIPVISVRNVYIFPGIPSYLEYGFNFLKESFCAAGNSFFSKTLFLCADEFEITEILNKAVDYFKDKVYFGSYPDISSDVFQLKLTIETDSCEVLTDAEAYMRSHLPHNTVTCQFPPGSREAIEEVSQLYMTSSTNNNSDLYFAVQKSVEVLEKCFKEYKTDSMCLSFNGGKDCTALLHLAYHVFLQMTNGRKIRMKALYVRSKEPFKEMEDFVELCVKRYKLEIITYDAPIREALLKLQRSHPRVKTILMGTRHTDPNSSDLQYFHMTDSDWPPFMRVCPLLHWSYHDVWNFLRKLDVPYCSLYDHGYTSLGCQNNTVPNPKLETITSDGQIFYKPAYLLKESDHERGGRTPT